MTNSPASPESDRRFALREPRFRLYFLASVCATLGVWVVRFLLGWSAWDLTESAFWVGVSSALMLLPAFVLSPVFGVIADRINSRNGLIITTALQGTIATLAAAVVALGFFSLLWLLLLSISVGAVTAAHQPVRLALMPRLVASGSLPSAIGISAMVFNSARILGPAAGGLLVAAGNLAVAFAVAAVLFACAVLWLWAIGGVEKPKIVDKKSMGRELLDGLAYVKGHSPIRFVLLLTLINGMLGRSVVEMLPALSGKILDGDAGTLATLTAMGGAGSILGGLIVSRQHGDRNTLLPLAMVCLVVSAGAAMVVQWAQTLLLLSGVVMLISMVTTMVGTACQASTQLMVDDHLRGRVLSLWTVITMGTPAIGSFFIGLFAEWFGFGPVLLSAGLLAIVLLALVYRLAKSPAANNC